MVQLPPLLLQIHAKPGNAAQVTWLANFCEEVWQWSQLKKSDSHFPQDLLSRFENYTKYLPDDLDSEVIEILWKLQALALEILTTGSTEIPLGCRLFVDPLLCTIETFQDRKKIISRELSLAIALLAEVKVVSFEEFLIKTFQFNFYDPAFHRQKIYNFLQKVKRILPPGVHLLTRYEKIYLNGNLQSIYLCRPSPATQQIRAHPCWAAFARALGKRSLQAPRKLEKALQVFGIDPAIKLMRRDFQIRMGVSKSESHRILVALQKQGYVVRVGRGKSSAYSLLWQKT